MLRSTNILHALDTPRRLMAPALILASLILAIVAGLSLATVDRHRPISLEGILATMTILCGIIPLAKRIIGGTFDIFEPIVGASIMLVTLFGIRPISMLLTDDAIYHGYSIESYFTATIVMGLVGTAAFILAYEATRRRIVPPRFSLANVFPAHLSTIYTYAIATFFLSLLLFGVHLSLGGSIFGALRVMAAGRSPALSDLTSQSSEYLSGAPLLSAAAAIAIVVASGPTIPLNRRIAILLLIAYPVAIFFMIGNRRFIIPSIAIPLVAYYLAAGRRPSFRTLAIVVPLLFLLLSAIPFARAQGARQQANGLVPIFRDALLSPVDSWKRFITGPDTQMINALAVELIVLNDSNEYYYGKATIGDVLLSPIPSAIFPAKPETARNQLLIDAFGGPCRGTGGLCPDFSVIGTFYQDFHYPGVIIGMVIFGAGSSWLWQTFKNNRSPYALTAVACWTVLLPIIIRAGFMPPFAWFLYFLVPSTIGLFLARRTFDDTSSEVHSTSRQPYRITEG